MSKLHVLATALCLLAAIGSGPALAQRQAGKPRVEFELITERGFPLTGHQKWIDFLRRLDIDNIRIRSSRPGDAIEIKTREAGKSVTHQVIGTLTSSDKLRLPGGSFRFGDAKGIAAWLEKVRDGGEQGAFAGRGTFGLMPKQLVELHEGAAAKVAEPTLGRPVREVVRRIATALPNRVVYDPAASTALGRNGTVADELQGISAGTALAAAVRPLGLVVVPAKKNREIVLQVVDVRQAEKSWPVGWPSQKSPGASLPKLFARLNVEIEDIPLSQALAALQKRLEVPFLYDHNALARLGVQPERVKVSLPAGNTYYKDILKKLLQQAELKSEVRMDEANQPFLWISSRRP